jgi:hypothetical protein
VRTSLPPYQRASTPEDSNLASLAGKSMLTVLTRSRLMVPDALFRMA